MSRPTITDTGPCQGPEQSAIVNPSRGIDTTNFYDVLSQSDFPDTLNSASSFLSKPNPGVKSSAVKKRKKRRSPQASVEAIKQQRTGSPEHSSDADVDMSDADIIRRELPKSIAISSNESTISDDSQKGAPKISSSKLTQDAQGQTSGQFLPNRENMPFSIPWNLRPTPLDSVSRDPDSVTILIKPVDFKISLRKISSAKKVKAALREMKATGYRFIRGGMAVDLPSGSNTDDFTCRTDFADIEVKISVPVSRPCRSGIIGDVSLDMTNEDIVEELNSEDVNTIKVMRAQRLGPKIRPSKVIKLVFEGDSLPTNVILGFQSHPVEIFVPKPLQCYTCQRLGHASYNCKGKVRCLFCAEPHTKDECPRTKLHCANCKKAHRASDPNCVKLRSARQICKVKAQKNISFFAAKVEVGKSFAQAARVAVASRPLPPAPRPPPPAARPQQQRPLPTVCRCLATTAAGPAAEKRPYAEFFPGAAGNPPVVTEHAQVAPEAAYKVVPLNDNTLISLAGLLMKIIGTAKANDQTDNQTLTIVAKKLSQIVGRSVNPAELERHATSLPRPTQPENYE